jgi:hypothetical protein
MYPEEWEIDLIKMLDRVVLEIYAKETDKKLKESSNK